MKFNKKDLFDIQRKAYDEFMNNLSDGDYQNSFTIKDVLTFYKVSDNNKSEIQSFDYETQINNNTLKELGFKENARVSKLFEVNKQTKQLIMYGDYNLK